jgi:hypothetical protein
MPKRYFELSDDVYIRGRWHLGDPVDQEGNEINPWQFAKGERLDITGRMRIPLDQRGRPLDFCKTPLTAAPVVNQKVATLLTELDSASVQLFPVDIPTQHEPYFLVNVLHVIKCIDDARCEEVQYWLPEDGRPDKTGNYRLVAGLRIDPMAVGDARIFRPWGWRVALIVREDLKQALERAGVTGLHFQEV